MRFPSCYRHGRERVNISEPNPMMGPNLRGWWIRRHNRRHRRLAPPFRYPCWGSPPNDEGGRARKTFDDLLPILIEVETLAPKPGADPDTEPETEHLRVYLKFLSAACAIGAALAIAVALRTKAAPPDSRGTAVEALKASRLLH